LLFTSKNHLLPIQGILATELGQVPQNMLHPGDLILVVNYPHLAVLLHPFFGKLLALPKMVTQVDE